jgi:hypothetical protein
LFVEKRLAFGIQNLPFRYSDEVFPSLSGDRTAGNLSFNESLIVLISGKNQEMKFWIAVQMTKLEKVGIVLCHWINHAHLLFPPQIPPAARNDYERDENLSGSPTTGGDGIKSYYGNEDYD